MQLVIQNIITNYRIKGKGTPLILLHGWGASSESFNPIFTKLSQKYQVYALDLPGFGKTQTSEQAWAVEDYARFVDNFLTKLNIHKAVFLGHSFGGRILIKLVTQKPELFDQLILTGAAGVKSKNNLRKNLFKLSAKIGKIILSLPGLKSLRQKARKNLYKAAGTDDYLTAGALKQTFVKVTQEDLTPLLSKINTQTLLIWGENDLDTPLCAGKIMHQQIINSDFKIINKAGHYAFVDQPNQFLQVLNSFLK